MWQRQQEVWQRVGDVGERWEDVAKSVNDVPENERCSTVSMRHGSGMSGIGGRENERCGGMGDVTKRMRNVAKGVRSGGV